MKIYRVKFNSEKDKGHDKTITKMNDKFGAGNTAPEIAHYLMKM